MKQKVKILFWVIIVVGILVRIYHFPTALQEMNCDEIITAENAKAIAETGKEIGGISYPVYLQGWGGQSVVLVYLMALSIKLLGYTLFAIRLPSLLISILSMFVFYDLAKKITKNEKIALIALALVSISPWHILQSIWSLDCNMFPHFLIIAIDIFYTGLMNQRKGLLYVSMFFFAITLYCYGVAIYFVPLFLLIMAIYLLKNKYVKGKDIVICATIFLILAMPIITMFALNVLHIDKNIKLGMITIPYYPGLSRTSDMIFFTPHKFSQLLKNMKSTLRVIFLQQDGAEWNAPPLFGTTYRVTLLFAILGCIKIMRNLKRKEKEEIANVLLITWISISILTGLIINEANINRLNSIWYVLFLLGAIGIYAIYERIRYQKVYKIVSIVGYCAIFLSFTIYFYGDYNKIVDNSGCFSRGFYQALSSVKTLDKQVIWYDNIKNDGCLALYQKLNHDDSKEYKSIQEEENLKEKIKNIGKEEALIIDVEFKQYENIKNSYQVGDFLIVTK